MTDTKGVLAVLDETYGLLAGPAAERLENSRAAVAELIEANKAYDAAKAAFVATIPYGSETGTNRDERERYRLADERRAAALARVEDLSC